MFYFLFFLCFGFSLELNQPRPLFAVDSVVWYDVDFYETVFKDDWEGLNEQKKEGVFQRVLQQVETLHFLQIHNLFPPLQRHHVFIGYDRACRCIDVQCCLCPGSVSVNTNKSSK